MCARDAHDSCRNSSIFKTECVHFNGAVQIFAKCKLKIDAICYFARVCIAMVCQAAPIRIHRNKCQINTRTSPFSNPLCMMFESIDATDTILCWSKHQVGVWNDFQLRRFEKQSSLPQKFVFGDDFVLVFLFSFIEEFIKNQHHTKMATHISKLMANSMLKM